MSPIAAETEKAAFEESTVKQLVSRIVQFYCAFDHRTQIEAFHWNFSKVGAPSGVIESLEEYKALAEITGLAWNYMEGYRNSTVNKLRDKKEKEFAQWAEANPKLAFEACKESVAGQVSAAGWRELNVLGMRLGFVPQSVIVELNGVNFSSTGKSTSKTEPRGIEALVAYFSRR